MFFKEYLKKTTFIRYFVKSMGLISVLLFVWFLLPETIAQVRTRQLRNQILQNQTPQKDKTTSKPTPRRRAFVAGGVRTTPLAPIVNPLENKNATLVFLESSDIWSFNQAFNPDVQVIMLYFIATVHIFTKRQTLSMPLAMYA